MNWKLWVKVAITIAILSIIAQSVDLTLFASTFLSLPLWASLIVVLGYIAGQVVSTFKWRALAIAGGIAVSSYDALRAYFIGMFVNCFGLGMVGGDVVRGVLVSGENGSKSLGVTSAIADRAHGLAVLASIGAFSALVFRPDFLDSYLIWLLVLIGSGISCGWFLGPRLVGTLFSSESKIGAKLITLSGMLTRDTKTLLYVTSLSVLFHLLQISLHWIMAKALGAEIPFIYLLTTVPFINILSSLPISWNGVGVREAGYLFFFTQQHPFLTQEQAVAMGALWLLSMTLASAIGGAVAFLSKDFSLSTLKAPAYQS